MHSWHPRRLSEQSGWPSTSISQISFSGVWEGIITGGSKLAWQIVEHVSLRRKGGFWWECREMAVLRADWKRRNNLKIAPPWTCSLVVLGKQPKEMQTWQDGPAGTCTCHQSRRPKFNPQVEGESQLSKSCPLISTHMLWDPPSHTQRITNTNLSAWRHAHKYNHVVYITPMWEQLRSSPAGKWTDKWRLSTQLDVTLPQKGAMHWHILRQVQSLKAVTFHERGNRDAIFYMTLFLGGV